MDKDDEVYLYNEHFSAIKENEIMSSTTIYIYQLGEHYAK